MAAALLAAEGESDMRIDSAGVWEGGGPDPFVDEVLKEIGVLLRDHEPKAMASLDLSTFDLAVALTPEAAAELRKFLPRDRIEFWEIENPSEARGGRDAFLDAYREVRDKLLRRIRRKFGTGDQKP
jgi:protein-tyrosine-phosphatase